MFVMEEDRAKEFEHLFETLLMLLKLNHNLEPEIKNHDDWNLTIYARDSTGMSNFSMSISATVKEFNNEWLASEVHVKIVSEEVDLSSIDMFNIDGYLDIYNIDFPYDEEKMLYMIKEIIRCV
jgi:hypothetical protein